MVEIIIYRKSIATIPDSTIATANMALADNYAFGRFSNKQAKSCLLDKLRNFRNRNTAKKNYLKFSCVQVSWDNNCWQATGSKFEISNGRFMCQNECRTSGSLTFEPLWRFISARWKRHDCRADEKADISENWCTLAGVDRVYSLYCPLLFWCFSF